RGKVAISDAPMSAVATPAQPLYASGPCSRLVTRASGGIIASAEGGESHEPDPFHQPASAEQAARLYPCGRGHRAGTDRLYRRSARGRPRRQGRRRLPAASGADVRESENRARRGGCAVPARGEAQQLPRRPRASADVPRGARQLSGRERPAGQHDHRDFGPGAGGGADRDRGGGGAPGRRARQDGIQIRGQSAFGALAQAPRASKTKVSTTNTGSSTAADHSM